MKSKNRLTDTELISCFKKLREEYQIELRDFIIENNIGLARHWANKYYNTNVEYDDLASLAYIGLIKAVDGFDYSKGYKFSTYASRCINNEIIMHLRSTKKFDKEVSMYVNNPIDDDGEVNLLDIVPSNINVEDECLDVLLCHQLIEEVKKLPDIEKRIFYLIVVERKLQREVALDIGKSGACVSRTHSKVLKKLQKRLCLDSNFEQIDNKR